MILWSFGKDFIGRIVVGGGVLASFLLLKSFSYNGWITTIVESDREHVKTMRRGHDLRVIHTNLNIMTKGLKKKEGRLFYLVRFIELVNP